jgi:hypothetical protein
VDVASSAVDSVGFDAEAEEVLVVWRDGRESAFSGDRGVFEGLVGAASVGRAVNELMRGG